MSLFVSDVVKMGSRQLEEAGIPDHKVEAELLYCWLKHIDRSRFFMVYGEPCDDRTMELYFDLIEKRRQHTPLQHLTSEQEFMGMTFDVRPGVLIPRMDTEVVVETAESLYAERKGEILDLCCGSGCIGVALGHHFPKSKVTAVDISPDAVALTKENANAWGVKMDVRQGDLYQPVRRKRFHMIVSNPPYIRTGVLPTLMPEVRDHEPVQALDGGESGLDFYEMIIAGAPSHLRKEGHLVLEIGFDQWEPVERLLMETECFYDIHTRQDLAGKDRVVTATLMKQTR